MNIDGKNIIAGKASALGKETFQALSATTQEQLDTEFTSATLEEVDLALTAAKEAAPVLRQKTPQEIADFLDCIAEEILNLGDALIQRCSQETALPEARLQGERGRTVGQLKMFAETIREGSWLNASIDLAQPEREPLPKPDLRRMLVPIGPVVVFGASNFPLAFSVAGGDTASALAAGNPVIVKAHSAHPGTSELVAKALTKAVEKSNMPAGTFSLLHGDGRTIGVALVEHPETYAVGFTGSQAGGRALFDAASRRPNPIPVYAEMSSSNPVFITNSALEQNGEQIASGLHASVTLGVGQFCTNPGLVVAQKGAQLDKLLANLSEHMTQTAAGTMLTKGICDAYNNALGQFENTDGVKVLAKSEAEDLRAATTLLLTDYQTYSSKENLKEEIFGPATLVVACDSEEEMKQLANNLEGHLTATLQATESDSCSELASVLESKVGRLIYNGFPTGVEVCPSMQHGGPYPATTDSHTTSVGTAAILRFARPVAYQNFPENLLPAALRNENSLNIMRLVDSKLTRDAI